MIGPGGIGKTRLAIETARTVAEAFPGGVVFVPLSPLSDASLVLGTIADTLGAHREPGVEPLDVAAAALGDEPTLLVLDNFEQVVAARTDVAALLEVPAAVVLVTSRQALRLRSERQYLLAPLAATRRSVLRRTRARRSPRLRAGRRQRGRRGGDLPSAGRAAAGHRAGRGTGPLLPPAALLGRLGERLDVLGGAGRPPGTAADPARDDGLELRPARPARAGRLHPARGVLRRLVARGRGSRVRWPGEPDVLEALSALLDASLLLEFDESRAEPRLHMLETVRTYAQEKLAASPSGPSASVMPRRLDGERGANLRAAVQRAPTP